MTESGLRLKFFLGGRGRGGGGGREFQDSGLGVSLISGGPMLLEILIGVIVETPSRGGYIEDYLGDFHRAY